MRHHLYSKHDVIVAYFPDVSYETARRRFKRWVNGNPYLLNALKKENYNIFQKMLTRRQLNVIFKFLGAP